MVRWDPSALLRMHCEAVKLHQVPLLEIRGEAKGGPETQLLAAMPSRVDKPTRQLVE